MKAASEYLTPVTLELGGKWYGNFFFLRPMTETPSMIKPKKSIMKVTLLIWKNKDVNILNVLLNLC